MQVSNLTFRFCVFSILLILTISERFCIAGKIQEKNVAVNSSSLAQKSDSNITNLPVTAVGNPKPIKNVGTTETILKNPEDDTELKADCRKNSDCPFNNCCTVGMMRFTFPSCMPYGAIDDSCTPYSSPKNFTLSYPNLKFIKVSEAYLMFCPCGSNLICDKSSATCQLSSDDKSPKNGYINDLSDY